MSNILENIARAADRWARQPPPNEDFRPSRLPQGRGLKNRDREHVNRLAQAVLGKARELAGMPHPPPGEIRVLKVIACRLCELNREACCRHGTGTKGDCPLGEDA